MQQGMKMPKKGEETSIKEQVRTDLQAAGMNISEDRKTIAEQMEIFRNPELVAEETGSSPDKVRAEIVDDLVSIISGDIEKISEIRATNPVIRENERNPEYKKAMDGLLKELKGGLKDLVNAQFEYGRTASTKPEFQKEHKTA